MDDAQNLLPGLTLAYTTGNLQLSLHYKTDLFLKQLSTESIVLNYATSNGLYRGDLKPGYSIKNNILQLNASVLRGDKISLTLGVLTNSYLYRLSAEQNFTFSFRQSFFKAYQIIAAVNYQAIFFPLIF